MEDIPVLVTPGSGRFLDELREGLRARGYAYPTEKTYLHWIRRFIFYHKYRHQQTMGKAEVEAFLNYLAVNGGVSPFTQRVALNALVYLYTRHFGRAPEDLGFRYAKLRGACPNSYTQTGHNSHLSP